MDRLDRLDAIAQIRAVKARYWRGVDTKDAALLRSVFTADVEIDFQGAMGGPEVDPAMVWHGADHFVEHTIKVIEGVVTAHQGFEPEISFVSDSEAAVIWPMQDIAWLNQTSETLPFSRFTGYGHYYDRFRKLDGEWKIAKIRLTRLRFEAA